MTVTGVSRAGHRPSSSTWSARARSTRSYTSGGLRRPGRLDTGGHRRHRTRRRSPPTAARSSCASSGPSIEVHGTLTALANSIGQARTVNTLPLEQYVADVAPAESPSTWATLGGAGPQGQTWGFQQTEAQTVAARSYVEANPLGYGGYADTCDQTCQSYPGMKIRDRQLAAGRGRHRGPGDGGQRHLAPWPPPSTRRLRAATRPETSSLPCRCRGRHLHQRIGRAIRTTTGRRRSPVASIRGRLSANRHVLLARGDGDATGWVTSGAGWTR